MFKNYFKTAFRNLIRNKNSGFDDFHANRDRIYRVVTEYHHSDSKDVFNGKGVPHGFPQALKIAFPK